MVITLNGWCRDRYPAVLVAMLAESGLPPVGGVFRYSGFDPYEDISDAQIAAIAGYFAPMTLDEAKAAKKQEIAAAFGAHIAGSVMVTLGYPMQFDTRDTLMVRGAIELAQANEQTALYLTDALDVTHEGVSIAEAQATLMEMMAAFAQAHAKKQTLRAQIDAAQTVEDVEAVEW